MPEMTANPKAAASNDRLRVEIGDSQTRYGRVLGGATTQYMLRVYIRFINETQHPMSVKSVAVTLEGTPLSQLLILGPSLPVLLTSKGQEQLRTDKIYSSPLTIPSASVYERYVFFVLPAGFQREAQGLRCTATVTLASHEPTAVPFVVNW